MSRCLRRLVVFAGTKRHTCRTTEDTPITWRLFASVGTVLCEAHADDINYGGMMYIIRFANGTGSVMHLAFALATLPIASVEAQKVGDGAPAYLKDRTPVVIVVVDDGDRPSSAVS